MEPRYKERLRALEGKMQQIVSKAGFRKEGAKFFKPDRDKYLNPTLNIEFDEDHCVNQFGICE